MDHTTGLWPDIKAQDPSRTVSFAAGLSLGAFLLCLESDRLTNLMRVETIDPAAFAWGIVALLVLGALALALCSRPLCRTVHQGTLCLVAALCSLGMALSLFAKDPDLWLLREIGNQTRSVLVPVLLVLWLQRVSPLGGLFALRSFGVGAVVVGGLAMLTILFEATAGMVFVTALPLAGAVLLLQVDAEAPCGDNAPPRPQDGWNAVRVISHDIAPAQGGFPFIGPLVKLVPFFCFAIIFGNVHFSWVSLQDESLVSVWVQLGASIGSIVCGFAAIGLANMRFGRSFESVANLLLTALALVALWMSTFLSDASVFPCLVLLNVAHKFTFLVMILFGFRFARHACEVPSFWFLAYFSFFAGTFVSSFMGIVQMPGVLNLAAAAALTILLAANIVEVMMLYGMHPKEGGEDQKAGPSPMPDTAVEDAAEEKPPCHEPQVPANPLGGDTIDFACHIIAAKHGLTRREEEILQLLVRGRSAARISEALCISPATTRTHFRNIYAKLDVHSQQDILDLYDATCREHV